MQSPICVFEDLFKKSDYQRLNRESLDLIARVFFRCVPAVHAHGIIITNENVRTSRQLKNPSRNDELIKT
jgi:hypothetical protein